MIDSWDMNVMSVHKDMNIEWHDYSWMLGCMIIWLSYAFINHILFYYNMYSCDYEWCYGINVIKKICYNISILLVNRKNNVKKNKGLHKSSWDLNIRLK